MIDKQKSKERQKRHDAKRLASSKTYLIRIPTDADKETMSKLLAAFAARIKGART